MGTMEPVKLKDYNKMSHIFKYQMNQIDGGHNFLNQSISRLGCNMRGSK